MDLEDQIVALTNLVVKEPDSPSKKTCLTELFDLLNLLDENSLLGQSIIRLFFYKKIWNLQGEQGHLLEKFFGVSETRIKMESSKYLEETQKIILENFEIDIPNPIVESFPKKKKNKTKVKVIRKIDKDEEITI